MLNFYEKRWINTFNPIGNTKHKRKPIIKKSYTTLKYHKHMKFRRLSKKSIIGFGMHKDQTVDKLLHIGKHLDLINMYYNLSHISFLDDVLRDLKITDKWVIKKPGINKELGFSFKKEVYPDDYEKVIEKSQKRSYRISKQTIIMIECKSNDKQFLKNRNQHR